MKREDYVKFLNGNYKPTKVKRTNHLKSVTDPRFAQSGRELVFNPIGYDTKPIYQNGVPRDELQPFDGMYKDKFDAFQAAKEFSDDQKKNINNFVKEKETKKDDTPT